MQENKTKMELQEELLDFRPTLKIEKNFVFRDKYFHLDVYRKKWVVYNDLTGIYKKEDIHSFTDIVDFELLEYEATIDKSNGGIFRAIAGAIVKDFSTSEKSHDVCTSMKIKITLNDSNNPVVFIDLLNTSVKKSSLKYRLYLEDAQKIMSILHLITTSNDNIENEETSMRMLENKTKMELQEELLNLRSTLRITSYFHVDAYRKKWIDQSLTFMDIKYKKEDMYSFTDIAGFELLEDEATIVKSNGNAIVRAATGGLLFGPVGFFFGALTTKEKSNDFCTSLKIKITINDINNPVVSIDLLNNSVKKSSWLYRSSLEDAQEIMSILYLITDSNDTIDNKETSMSSVAAINDTLDNKETSMSSVAAINDNIDNKETSMISIADELKKLKDLLDSCALNQTEFDELKSKLINNYK